MKTKIILLTCLSFLAFNFAQAQGNWVVDGESVSPNTQTISSNGTVTASGTFTWASSATFLNDNHMARLSYAMPTGVDVSTGVPSLTYANNAPVQGVTFNMNAGGWTCEFAPGTTFAPGTQLTFKVADLSIKDDKSYTHQQLTHFISFVASPRAEANTDNAATITFNTLSNTPLSVNLLSFDARLIEEGAAKVKLDWVTASEVNADKFIVQRSQNSLDWEDVVSVKAKGNSSSTEVKYQDFDNNPLFGLTYYRLKQLDMDKNAVFSDIRQVNRVRDGKIALFPNPTHDVLNIDYTLEETALMEVKVLTIGGRVVQSVMAWKEKGNNTMQMDISELANGMYNVNVYKNNKMYSTGKVQKH